MGRPERLTDEAVQSRIRELDGWSVVEGKLHRTFRFPDFRRAWMFMTAMAQTAEKLDHHPEWFNVYSTVKIDLTTHDCGGISDLDFRFAAVADRTADDLSDRG